MSRPSPADLAVCRTCSDTELAEAERELALDPVTPLLVAVRMVMTERLMAALGSDGVVHCFSEET